MQSKVNKKKQNNIKSTNKDAQYERLASLRVKRESWQISVSLLGGFFIFLLFPLGYWLANRGYVTPVFLNTLYWCIFPYIIVVYLTYQSVNLPSTEKRTALIINSALPFLVLVLVLALLQKPYARSAILLAALITTIWFWLASNRAKGFDQLNLIVLDSSLIHTVRKEISQLKSTTPQLEFIDWQIGTYDLSLFDAVLIPPNPNFDSNQKNILAEAKQLHMRIYTTGTLIEMLSGRVSDEVIKNEVWQPDSNPAYDLVKRIIDLTAVLLTIPMWVPLAIAVALLIKIDDSGSSLFTQLRTGRHGKPFKIYKFRTMRQSHEKEPLFAEKNDSRITRVGGFLRKIRLDEIPQLINILRGDMSLIGPRPEQHGFVSTFSKEIPSYPYRHLVRPGLTGWAQVMQGYAASVEDTEIKLSYDLYYVKHYGLALDLVIIAKTIKTILTGFGAR